ncbi:MAG: hypothetical protein U1E89_19660 [Burkholderiaceae bacterium]
MRLDPYRRVDGTAFTATQADVVAARGQPGHAARNDVGLNELDYGDVVFRFQDNGRLEEVTLQATVLHLGAIAVPFAALAAFVRDHDPEVFERVGFIVSPAFGLAFDPDDAPWVTALAAHCIDSWRAL